MQPTIVRLRRNRQYTWLRSLVAENNLNAQDLVYPVFVSERDEDSPSTGIRSYTTDGLIKHLESACKLGIKAVSIFPKVNNSAKDRQGSESFNPDNLICRTVRKIKDEFNDDLGVICDVALDPYTDHGHDGILDANSNDVDNDQTLPLLAKQALTLANSGADFIAPSDMMDGRVGYLRNYLDKHQFTKVGIISYAAKYASKLYAPFRQVVGSELNQGKKDKATYQMDLRNHCEAMREIAIDIEEGADIILIKPAIFCLDVIFAAKQSFDIPIFAYQVSGEYKMLQSYADEFSIPFAQMLFESLICIKRAGAKSIFTYGALEIAQFLR